MKELRDELKTHDQRCDDKIAAALEKAERDCDEAITRKLRGQAAALRAEFREGLLERSESHNEG